MADYGTYRANPIALPAFVEIEKVAAEQRPVASDLLAGAVASARSLTGMTISFWYHPEGDDTQPMVQTTETVTFADYAGEGKHLTSHLVGSHRHGLPEVASAAVTSPRLIEKVISDYLRYAGESRGGNVEEIQTIVNASYDGTTLSVEHIGAVEITSLIFDDASTLAGVRRTNKQMVADYVAYVVGAAGDLKYGGLTDTGLGSYAYTINDAAANATVATTLKTDAETALTNIGFPYTSVKVTVNDVGQNFCLHVTAPTGNSLQIGTKFFTIGNVRVEYS